MGLALKLLGRTRSVRRVSLVLREAIRYVVVIALLRDEYMTLNRKSGAIVQTAG